MERSVLPLDAMLPPMDWSTSVASETSLPAPGTIRYITPPLV
jgi:hypothetical protein